MLGEGLDVGLAVPPVLDGVVHPAQDPRRVGDGLLVTDLRPGGSEVGDVRTLVVRRYLESGHGSGGGLLEDEGDLLSRQSLRLGPRVLRGLQGLRQVEEVPHLVGLEVDLLEEAPTFQVV